MKHFKASLPATMLGLASQAGLKLAFGQPRTDGKTVWITDIPVNPSIEDYNLCMSDLIHEIGHCKYTDFKTNTGHTKNPLLHSLTNVFEDIRIEKLLEAEFLGAKSFLDSGYQIASERKMTKGSNSFQHPADAFTMFLLLDSMVKVLDRSYFEIELEGSYEACLQFGLDPDVLDSIQTLCETRVPQLSSTQDAADLAKEVFELLKQSNESNKNGSGQNENSDSQENSKESSDDSDQSSVNNSSATEDLLSSEVTSENPLSLKEAVEESYSSDNSLRSLVLTDDIAEGLSSANKSNYLPSYYLTPDVSKYASIKNSVVKDIYYLRNRLIHRWTNETRTRAVLNELDGRFSARDAVRCIATGDNNYLVKRSRKINHKPAICVLADLSGSMDDVLNNKTLLQHQNTALITLVEACSIANIPLSIIGFSDKVISIKDWNTSLSLAKGMIGGIRDLYGTDLEAAVFEGIKSLMSRKENRKILITLTDGQVSSQQTSTIQNVMHLAHNQIDFYGLGIGVDISNIFEKGGQIEATQITQSISDILSK